MNNEFVTKFIDLKAKYAGIHNKFGVPAFSINKESMLEYRFNLTPQQVHFAMFLYYSGPTQLIQIGKDLRLLSPNVVKLGNALIQKGLCQKASFSTIRSVFLELTDKGKEAVRVELKAYAEVFAEKFNKCMSSDEQEEVLSLYNRMIQLLSRVFNEDK